MQKVIQTLQLRIFGSEGDRSTFSQEVSPASRFLSPASAEVRRTADGFGLQDTGSGQRAEGASGSHP